MLRYLRSDLFTSPAQTLVNTVNTVGVMGKGIAKTFKGRYPEMFRDYARVCTDGRLSIGALFLWRGPDKWVLSFPTKTTWRRPSQIEYIHAGLRKFVTTYEELGISSASFPPLGCGNGELDWAEVKPVMESYLKSLPIQIYIHDRHYDETFVPEHLTVDASVPPATFDQFLVDIVAVAEEEESLRTLRDGTEFQVEILPNHDLRIIRKRGVDTISHEETEAAWSALQVGVLTADQFSGEVAKRYKSYLFALLSRLPYVSVTEVQHIRRGNTSRGYALFFDGGFSSEKQKIQRQNPQRDLWRSRK